MGHAVRVFAAATNMLNPHNLDVKQAARMISDALPRLGKVPLSTALDFYDRHGKTMKAAQTVPEVMTELVECLRKDGCSGCRVVRRGNDGEFRFKANDFCFMLGGCCFHVLF